MPVPSKEQPVQGIGAGVTSSVRGISRMGMEPWKFETNRTISSAVALSTRNSYAAAYEEFLTFSGREGISHPCLVTVDHLEQFRARCQPSILC